ncbi:peroxidase-related enzyme [Aquimarina sp. MMG016]|uniref:carboxymuconolactone decarboxylase family protein n=1 Tax=Aquimarina sp. MMG016 TaxID=2822690 RepID=UPI001B3A2094|nr:peroxidase-related enzyme [Aquimarina sp. MMG016]MBQ4818797.1 peroxidase-related enzyme [Aquimarina sp. MMG016]
MKTISTILDDAKTTPEVETTFTTIQEELNAPFVPNFFKVWASVPDTLKGIFPVMQHILTEGVLDRKLKEMIMIAISSSRDCVYCEIAHQVFCSMAGGEEAQIASLKKNATLPESADPMEKAAIDYAVRLSKDPKSSSQKDFDHLMKLGYSEPQIMEMIAMSGMGVFYNHLADATKINIDEEFSGVTTA